MNGATVSPRTGIPGHYQDRKYVCFLSNWYSLFPPPVSVDCQQMP